MQSLLSPLVNKDYCSWWYTLALVNLVLIVLIILGFLFSLFSKDKDIQKHSIPMLYSVIAMFISYFQSRILYGMCLKSLK